MKRRDAVAGARVSFFSKNTGEWCSGCIRCLSGDRRKAFVVLDEPLLDGWTLVRVALEDLSLEGEEEEVIAGQTMAR